MDVLVPRMNASDDVVVLREWPLPSGARISKGDIVAVCETSKSAFEIPSPADGFLHYQAEIDSEVRVGGRLAIVSETETFQWPETEQVKERESQVISKAARELMEAHQIPAQTFAHLELVSGSDVRAYLTSSTPLDLDKIVIVGGGGHGQVCIDLLRRYPQYKLAGVVDDGMTVGQDVLGVPVLGGLNDLPRIFDEGVGKAVMAIASILNLPFREELLGRVRDIGFEIPTLVHASAIVEPSAKIGRGVQILAGAIVGSAVELHQDCVINHGSIVSHDCVIHRNAHLAPGCILAGAVTVGANSLVGMGVSAYVGLKIGKNAIINNGLSLFHDVPDDARVR